MTGQTYVRDVMVPMTQAIRVTQTLVAARQRMQGDMRVKSLIVVDDHDRPLGAVRYNDVSDAEAGGTVADVLTSNIPTISADQSLEDVAGLMTEHDVDRLAVVDSGGTIVGELTRSALTLSETHGTTGTTGESLSDATAGRDTPAYQVAQNMSVVGSDGGNIGKVRDVLSDALTGALTHIVVHTGLIFGHDKSVPADLVDNVSGDQVQLKVDKGDIEALPDLEKAE
ncbi:MAG TPA: CBS domain-containing protein [Thermomicrobiales bacterium]|jgi:CBS domain-containing protein/sporulation protein YlmC with PRC-barrel domain